MASVIMVSVTYKPFMLSVFMLSVFMLSVFMLSVFMLSVVTLSVVMQNVVAPLCPSAENKSLTTSTPDGRGHTERRPEGEEGGGRLHEAAHEVGQGAEERGDVRHRGGHAQEDQVTI
jgi:hypothetical protein